MRIAIVVQRYGLEINGGAEYFCRKLAEQLALDHEVEVLTTRALNYMTWENHYSSDEEIINKVKVRRFSVDRPRPVTIFNKVYDVIEKVCSWQDQLSAEHRALQNVETGLAHKMSLKSFLKRAGVFLYFRTGFSWFWERIWMILQGPASSGLSEFIDREKSGYDVFIFKTFVYGTTYHNIGRVGHKSILIPTAHSNERVMRFGLFDRVFAMARCLAFSVPEEQQAVRSSFPSASNPHQKIIGFGLETDKAGDAKRFRKKYSIEGPFILYLGRISIAKGCQDLFADYRDQRVHEHLHIPLVTIGKAEMDPPEGSGFRHLGFVSEQDKYDALAAASLMVVPSRFESLSIVLLESWLLKTPVLVNQDCDVLEGQCLRSGGGMTYGPGNFASKVEQMLKDPAQLQKMGEDGRNYVLQHYTWKKVLKGYQELFEKLK